MDTDKNIQLTLVRPPEDTESELRIDILLIFDWMKRFFLLWLVLALSVGMLLFASAHLGKKIVTEQKTSTIIGYNNTSLAKDDDMIAGLKSSVVVESAMESLGMDVLKTDKVRDSISIEGLISEKAQDRMSLYYGILNRSANMDAVKQLLATDISADGYVVTLDYGRLGLSSEDGCQLLNAIIQSYRKEYESNNNFNSTIGNAFSVFDYKDYDYAEAAELFDETLTNVDKYIRAVKNTDSSGFRSSKTGYSFNDLLQMTTMLKDIELDQLTSYIAINAVTSNSAAQEKTYYEWLIEETRRKMAVVEERYASISASITSYEKDPVVYLSDGTSLVASDEGNDAEYYDNLITEKIATRKTISAYSKKISYYRDLCDALETKTEATARAKQKTEEYLA
ncbi:MAG: hypothetical protein J5449_13315, partial [Oscillospiraceae bacterium]|nr:hypothetical protein [Oscillospiraceae bacterium]